MGGMGGMLGGLALGTMGGMLIGDAMAPDQVNNYYVDDGGDMGGDFGGGDFGGGDF